jgi:hypothetical protein
MEVAMLVIVLNVISLATAFAFLGLSIVHAYNVESDKKSSGSTLAEWLLIAVCASVIAMRMSVDADWVDVTVSLIFLATAAIHVRILRIIHKAKASQ